jgi:hypothetical protein
MATWCAPCRRFVRAHRALLRRLLIAAGLVLALAAIGPGTGSRSAAGDCKAFYP